MIIEEQKFDSSYGSQVDSNEDEQIIPEQPDVDDSMQMESPVSSLKNPPSDLGSNFSS